MSLRTATHCLVSMSTCRSYDSIHRTSHQQRRGSRRRSIKPRQASQSDKVSLAADVTTVCSQIGRRWSRQRTSRSAYGQCFEPRAAPAITSATTACLPRRLAMAPLLPSAPDAAAAAGAAAAASSLPAVAVASSGVSSGSSLRNSSRPPSRKKLCHMRACELVKPAPTEPCLR